MKSWHVSTKKFKIICTESSEQTFARQGAGQGSELRTQQALVYVFMCLCVCVCVCPLAPSNGNLTRKLPMPQLNAFSISVCGSCVIASTCEPCDQPNTLPNSPSTHTRQHKPATCISCRDFFNGVLGNCETVQLRRP